MGDAADVRANSLAAWPGWYAAESTASQGWYYVTDNETFVWSGHRWVAATNAGHQKAGGQPDLKSHDQGVLWYWDGGRWMAPGDDGDPSLEKVAGPKFAWSLVIALAVTAVIAAMTWAIGDRLDWAVCPGQNCNSGATVTIGDVAEILVVLGLPLGALFVGLDWVIRAGAASSRRRALAQMGWRTEAAEMDSGRRTGKPGRPEPDG